MPYYRKYNSISTNTKFLKPDIFNIEKEREYNVNKISDYKGNYLRYCMKIAVNIVTFCLCF